MDMLWSMKYIPPSSYDAIKDTSQESTMWYNTCEVSLFQEEMQEVDIEVTYKNPSTGTH